MTPIPPSGTSLTDEPKGQATDDLKRPDAGDDADDSLEAILLQASAKAPEVAPPKALGAKTLMGIGIEGLNLPAILRAEEKKRKAGKKSARAEAEPDVPVDDLVEEDPTVANLVPATATASSSENRQVASLLDDVAQALNVQASEVRDRARGRLPGMSAAGAGSSRARLPTKIQRPGQSEAEFEDPSEGPTALTPGMIAIADAEKATQEKSALNAEQEAEEEAVVLGHAVQSGSAKYAQARTSESRPVVVPPVPGSPTSGTPAAVGRPPGVALRTPTPAGGLPLPLTGRARLPTPVPGSLGLPNAASVPGISYQTLPFGIASPKASDLTATAPSTPISLEASRRFGTRGDASVGADGVPVRRTLKITEPVVRFATLLPTVLTANVKLATLSLAGLIAVTFVGGLFVGMVVGRGQGRAEPAVTHVVTVPVPVSPEPHASTTTVVPATTGSTTPAAQAPAANPSAARAMIPAEPSVARLRPETGEVPLPPGSQPSEPESDSKAAKRASAVVRVVRPHRPVAPAETTTATAVPAAGPKTPAVKPPVHPAALPGTASKPVVNNVTPKPAVSALLSAKPVVATAIGKPIANNNASAKPAVTNPSTKPAVGNATAKPIANNATAKPVAKSKTKTTWHDPFSD